MISRQEDRAQESSFLRRIIAYPTDDVARLIYADWLEERGEPRGEFIRQQITLANGHHEPGEFSELFDKASALYWKHHRYWNGQVYRQWIGTPLEGKRAHEGGLRGWRYRRGFPEILDINAEFFVQHADLFLGAAPFQEIILRRPPQNLNKYFREYAFLLKRVNKLVLPMAHDLNSIPAELADRIRIGVRAQQTIAEFRAHPFFRR